MLSTAKFGATAVCAVALVLPIALSAPAGAAGPAGRSGPNVLTVSTQVQNPFNIAVDKTRIRIADGIEGAVLKLSGSTTSVSIPGAPGSEVAGVAFSADGTSIAVAETDSVVPTARGKLQIVGPGRRQKVVDLSVHEETVNPDGIVHYGVDHPSTCVTEALSRFIGTSTNYDGFVQSRPFSVTPWTDSSWVVADRDGNDIVKVNRFGGVSTVAVLPRQQARITPAIASAAGLPACTVGVVYNFEAEPTDVEVGPDGALYVSTLGGAIDFLGLRAPGSIYRIAPGTGTATRIVTGLDNPTNLAFDRNNRLYVVNGAGISVVKNGVVTPFVALPAVAALEAGNQGLYAGTLVQFVEDDATGSIVYIKT